MSSELEIEWQHFIPWGPLEVLLPSTLFPLSIRSSRSRKGHLSNEATCRFIRHDLDSSISTLILGHLSEHTNHPARVALEADRALNGRRLFTRLVVAEPRQQSEVFCY